MGGLISWWVRNAVAANLLMVFIIVSGLIAWTTIEKEVQPIVKLPLVQVSLTWPGASPKEIEQQVVQRVEAAIKNIDKRSLALTSLSSKRMFAMHLMVLRHSHGIWNHLALEPLSGKRPFTTLL